MRANHLVSALSEYLLAGQIALAAVGAGSGKEELFGEVFAGEVAVFGKGLATKAEEHHVAKGDNGDRDLVVNGLLGVPF